MFQEIRQAVSSAQRIRTLVLAGFGLLSLMFGFAFAMNVTEGSLFRRLGLSGITAPAFLIAAVLSAVIPRMKLRRVMTVLGAYSDDDMDRILSQAEPLGGKTPPMLWITAEHVINFESVQAYEIRSIRKMAKKMTVDSDFGSTDYRIELKLIGKPSKDCIIVQTASERNQIHTRLMQAYQTFGNPGDLL